jgi:hypothetical protein
MLTESVPVTGIQHGILDAHPLYILSIYISYMLHFHPVLITIRSRSSLISVLP